MVLSNFFPGFKVLCLLNLAATFLNDNSIIHEVIASAPILSINLIPKNEVVRRLTHERQLQIHQTDALFQGLGTHYVDLWVGTPIPQRQTVMVDTGNSITAFPCAGCRGCGSPNNHNFYNHTASQRFHASTCDDCILGTCQIEKSICDISMNYEEGSAWAAFEAHDMAYFGGSNGNHFDPANPENIEFELSFGCQTQLSSHFINQLEDGILGLSKKKRGALWYQMYQAKRIAEKSFSLCFGRQPIEGRQGTNIGVMSMGGYNANLHHSPMVFAKDYGSDLYTVYVEAVYLRTNGGESASVDLPSQHTVHKINISESELNSDPVIVDSGATYTYFNRQIMTPFKETWKEITGFDYRVDVPLSLTYEQILALPTLIIQMRADPNSVTNGELNSVANLAGDIDPSSPSSIIVAVPASHYMTSTKYGKYKPEIYIDHHGRSLLGANTMQGHDVFFDLEHDRIGWAESTCGNDDSRPDSR